MGSRLVVTLIRHGLTTYNEESRYIGATDLALSTNGKKQMNELKASLTFSEPFLLFTSDLLRCKETASILFPDKETIEMNELREIHFGDWEGKTYDELREVPSYQKWLLSPFSIAPPNGESFEQFQKRVHEAFIQIVKEGFNKKVEQLIIITHGGVIREILTNYAPEKREFFEWNVPIGSIITLSGDYREVRRGLRFTSLQVEHITEKTIG